MSRSLHSIPELLTSEDGAEAASIRQVMADHTGDEVLLWRLQGGQENRPRRGCYHIKGKCS